MIHAFFCRLKDRSTMVIEGRDCAKLLQGITTNHIEKFMASELTSTSSLFLDPKGRILFDCQIIKPINFSSSEPALLLDVHSSALSMLDETLKKYAFRKKVNFSATNHHIAAVYSSHFNITETLGTSFNLTQFQEYKKLAFIDPRIQNLGVRVVTETEIEKIEEGLENTHLDHYKAFRILCGVSEGPCISQSIPHHLNFQYLNCINLNKGCYVGQELIARTSSQGVVRTGVYPFYVGEKKNCINRDEFIIKNENFKIEGKIFNSDGLAVGEVVESSFNVGLGKMKKDKVNEECWLENGKKIQLLDPVYSFDKLVTV